MKSGKIIFLNIILIFFAGCKKEVKNIKKTAIIPDTTKIAKVQTPNKDVNYLEKLNENKSFTISCGGGCAIAYTAIEVQKTGSSFKVRFSVDNYTDEVLSETFEESYIFSYDKFGNINTITGDGETQNLLETLPESAKKSFEEFGKDIIKL